MLRQLGYAHDLRDNLGGITDVLAPLNSESFTYTAREHLMSASGPYGALAFAYDGVGNRLTYTASGVSDSYSYPPTSNRLSGIALGVGGARILGYDGAGNVVSEDRNGTLHSYSYDAAGRLSALSIGGSLVASYRYDAMGRQVIRTLPGGTIHSIFDSQGRRIAEYDQASGALIREYVWMDWDPVAVIEGGVVYYVRADHLGRPAFATDATGAVVWSASCLPFGEVRVSTGPLPPMRFPGQWFQAESGLHQNWMRDYDPTTGRYLQADPLGLVDGASVYGYVRQNPGRWVDPRGEFGVPGAIIGGIIGGMSAYSKSGCISDVTVGIIAGAVTGALGSYLKIVPSAIAGATAAASGQIAANNFASSCECKTKNLLSSPSFWVNTGLGGFVGGTASGVASSVAQARWGGRLQFGKRSRQFERDKALVEYIYSTGVEYLGELVPKGENSCGCK